MNDFWLTLFNPGEKTCMSETPYGTGLSDRGPLKQFFSINPMHTKRADANVTCFRNILVEFDTGTVEEQKEIIRASELPYSTLTFSGSKSLHAIISLQNPIEDIETYRTLAKAVYKKLPQADQKVYNPSRFSRTPRAFRDNGAEQTLLEVRSRIALNTLLNWTGPLQKPKQPTIIFINSKLLPIRSEAFLTYGASEGSWNAQLFLCACEMARAGFDISETETRVEAINGVLDKSDRRTIKSAYDAVRREG